MRNRPTIKQYKPLHPDKFSVNIQDVQRHRILYSYFIQYWRNNRKSLNFSDRTNLILKFIPQLCFVPCFLLAYTCCRVGELKQLKIRNIRLMESFTIKSSKSKHIRWVSPLLNFQPDLRRSLDHKTMLCVVSYDHLKNAIRSAKFRAKIPQIENILDLTHIFRHYEASHLYSQGVEIDIISNKLGHLNKETTLKYIH